MKKLFTSLILLMAGVMATYATDYNLWVAGTRVTSSNASNIMEGVSYNSSTNVLTLDNCTFSAGENYAIGSSINNLQIKVKGICRVEAANDVFYLEASTEINGIFGECGSLYVESTSNSGAAFWVKNGSTLTLYNLWLVAEGKNYCFYGDGNEKIVMSCLVMKADITEGNGTGAVHGFTLFTQDYGDAYLTTGAFNSTAKAVCSSSSSTTELTTVSIDASLYVGSAIARIGSTMSLTPEGLSNLKVG